MAATETETTATEPSGKGGGLATWIYKRLKDKFELFVSDEGVPFATTEGGRTIPIDSEDFRAALRSAFRKVKGFLPPKEAINSAVDNIADEAKDSGRVERLYLRSAETSDAIYVDLANGGDVVRVTEDGWSITKAEIERRLAEERGGADQFNNLGILLDTVGTGDAPKKQWVPLSEGVALLLDDARNPELKFHEHRKRVREDWAATQREDRRRDHEHRERERKRDIEGDLRQRFARLPVTRAFAAAYEQLEPGPMRDLCYRVLPYLYMSESSGVSLGYLPSADTVQGARHRVFRTEDVRRLEKEHELMAIGLIEGPPPAGFIVCGAINASDDGACMCALNKIDALLSLEMNEAIGNLAGFEGQQYFYLLLRSFAASQINPDAPLSTTVRARLDALKAKAVAMTEVR